MRQPSPRPDPWPRAAVRALARPLAWALLLCVAGATTWTTSARAQPPVPIICETTSLMRLV